MASAPKYALPDLGFDYGALEPHVSGKIMELHHDKHHATYVKNANETFDALAEARAKGDFTKIAALEHKLAFNVSGHVLHSIFWRNLTPDGGDEPTGPLADAIKRDFGSFETFKKQLNATASTIMGSGWAALAFDPIAKRLLTTQIHDHQGEIVQGGVPILVLDAWEHAYYLQYQTDKAKFFDAVWNLWNWDDVAQRFAAAQSLDLLLPRAAPEAPQPAVH